MRPSPWVEASIVLVVASLLTLYLAFFLIVATQTACLMAIPGPYYYLPQRIVAAIFLASGVLVIIRKFTTRRRHGPMALDQVYLALAVVLIANAVVRLGFVGFVGGSAMCGYPP